MLLLYPLAAQSVWTIGPMIITVGTMGALAAVLQTRLMDVAGEAQTLAAPPTMLRSILPMHWPVAGRHGHQRRLQPGQHRLCRCGHCHWRLLLWCVAVSLDRKRKAPSPAATEEPAFTGSGCQRLDQHGASYRQHLQSAEGCSTKDARPRASGAMNTFRGCLWAADAPRPAPDPQCATAFLPTTMPLPCRPACWAVLGVALFKAIALSALAGSVMAIGLWLVARALLAAWALAAYLACLALSRRVRADAGAVHGTDDLHRLSRQGGTSSVAFIVLRDPLQQGRGV